MVYIYWLVNLVDEIVCVIIFLIIGLDSSATEATIILWCHTEPLSQSLINPVKVSQLLFSERCISEATLDKMERPEGTLDEKKTTLLSTVHVALSSDHKKLKILATVLSMFEERAVIFIDYYTKIKKIGGGIYGIIYKVTLRSHYISYLL